MHFGVRLVLAALFMLLSVATTFAGDPVQRDHPIVPPFERFYAGANADLTRGGQLLLGELNCLRCHAAADAPAKKSAPVLDHVGSRVKHGYLRKFLIDPHKTKPGTTMPDVLAGFSERERGAAVEALVHLLASTGKPKSERPDRKQISAGRDLFHKVGCTACHETRDAAGKITQVLPTSVPIAKTKYTVASLKSFLENPLASRPSGRMPGILSGKEAHAVASYLLQDIAPSAAVFNMSYAYYEGSWGDKLPDFARIKPTEEGKAADFDVTVARRTDSMALKFDGYLKVDKDSQYKFWLTSDDGSKLWIDDKLVVSNDGVHAATLVTNSAFLGKGVHKLTLGIFNAGGGVELSVDISGGGLPRQSLAPHVFLTPEAQVAPTPAKKEANEDAEIVAVDTALVDKGRGLFASLGCANCHQLNVGGQTIAPKNTAPTLAKLQPAGGCLESVPKKNVPWFSLSAVQRSALAAAIKSPAPKVTDAQEVIARSLATFNCYACHDRDKIGGPEEERNKSFATVQPEMGDEGRLPPSLNGVGAKLKPDYLRKILDQGSHDRPYMHARMPRFGDANVGHLVKLFADTDKLEPAAAVKFSHSPAKVKADGRHLVGSQAFGCIKCHTFKGQKAEGVQGIDMALMPARLQRDWFVQYLLDPNKFRPGTRMPAAWPKGEVVLTKILDGKAMHQIEGIWVYLSDGNKAQLPVGMSKQSIPLIPTGEAIIYRNFIEGGGPRAIGVGYPEKVNVCFDANNLRLAMIWQGAFIDAARHWTDRGSGFEPPLGDNILHLPQGVSFAALGSEADAWPTKSAKESGAQFKGYRLGKDERATFLYRVNGADIEDTPNALIDGNTQGLRRTLVVQGSVHDLYYRAAVADKIESVGDGWYRVGSDLRVRIDGAELRQSNGKMELLVRVRLNGGKATMVQDYVW
jgi:mono/diheme cytochrome c family protein